MDWGAIRAEYLAGGISQRALARRHGVAPGALGRIARAEGWAAQRDGGARTAAESDGEIALRVRRKLLLRMERMADDLPEGALTEFKPPGEGTRAFKLRDFVAAFRELAGDAAGDGADRDGVRVIIDP